MTNCKKQCKEYPPKIVVTHIFWIIKRIYHSKCTGHFITHAGVTCIDDPHLEVIGSLWGKSTGNHGYVKMTHEIYGGESFFDLNPFEQANKELQGKRSCH